MTTGVSLDEIVRDTKVSVELWEAMERNDFARWPTGIYARAFIREYAEMIGVDPDSTLDEFCRWFPRETGGPSASFAARPNSCSIPSSGTTMRCLRANATAAPRHHLVC